MARTGHIACPTCSSQFWILPAFTAPRTNHPHTLVPTEITKTSFSSCFEPRTNSFSHRNSDLVDNHEPPSRWVRNQTDTDQKQGHLYDEAFVCEWTNEAIDFSEKSDGHDLNFGCETSQNILAIFCVPG